MFKMRSEAVTREPMISFTVRIPRRLRDSAKAKADAHDEILSEVIRGALDKYVKAK